MTSRPSIVALGAMALIVLAGPALAQSIDLSPVQTLLQGIVDPRDGHIVNHDLAEYHVAVNADVPQITVDLLEERDPWANPLQAKGIGELGICGAAASITNAIHDATGVRVRDYPATLDKVIAGM